jgi:dTDP-glucose 4,6-dehydratase
MNNSKLTNQFQGKHVLITGGAGFIGSHIAERLMNTCKITLFDNLRRNSISTMQLTKNIQLVKGDVLDYTSLEHVVKDADIIYHLAAVAGINTVTKSPITTIKINLIGTYNLFQAIEKTNPRIEKVFLASTSEVYGKYSFLGKEDDLTSQGPVSEPRWCYATSKLAAEHLAYSYFLEKKVPVTILRFFNVYGPRQTGESAMHNFIERALHGETLRIFGSGLQIRSWCFIQDAIEGVMLATSSEKAVGKVFNIGNPKTAITIASLADLIIQLTGSKSIIEYIPKDFADVELRIPDITLAQKVLGYLPKIDLQEGIKRTVKWYKGERREVNCV